MQTAPPLLSIFLIALIQLTKINALCNLENGTIVRCHELEDVKYIETYDLESLKASVADSVLGPGLFTNLSTLRHLDLSNGDMKRIEPGTFRELRDLKSLDLADNKIEYLELASLDGLNQLRSLNLRKNNLRQLPPVLVRLKNLRHLDVQGNPFQCNCATLRVRDLLSKRGVKMSKKVVCAGPNNMKGTSLLKPDASIICAFEEQDKEMQKDQPTEGSGDHDKDDPWDEYDEEGETSETSETPKPPETKIEHVEIETPSPTSPESQTSSSIEISDPTKELVKATTDSTSTTDTSLEKAIEEDELFFDNDDRKDHSSTTEAAKKEEIKDNLFYPVEGSGDEEEGSGEGSGTKDDWWSHEETVTTSSDVSTTSGESLLDILFGVFWTTTAAPEEKKDPDLEEEQFLDVSSSKTPTTEEEIVTKKAVTAEATSSTNSAIIVDASEVNDMSKSGKVKAELNDELAEVSSARQSKKGMGSYIVLAALLAVLAALIGFAAYKGDFCKKKRKRDDVENGTEMKDMQKALLDSGNSTQPKIASARNGENAPLVSGTPDDDVKDTKIANDRQISNETPKAPNGISDHADPIKPPRKLYNQSDDPRLDEDSRGDSNSLKDDSVSARTSPVEPSSTSTTVNNGTTARHPEMNGPPLSPGAQRVKITLQENPDSVPRTPILITRTMAGENLVKTP